MKITHTVTNNNPARSEGTSEMSTSTHNNFHAPTPWAIGKTSPDIASDGGISVRGENGAGWDAAHCFGAQARAKPRGYTPCACPDCMEIGFDGGLCWECEEAQCDGESECDKAPWPDLDDEENYNA